MRTIALILLILSSGMANAQLYSGCDLGFDSRELKANSPLISLHIGYQVNNVIVPDGVGLIEYNQRVLVGGISPRYLGGRVGYGFYTGEFTMFSVWGGPYYELVSSDEKGLNNWTTGYGLSVLWKNVTFEISKVEFYQVSIGCRILFDSINDN